MTAQTAGVTPVDVAPKAKMSSYAEAAPSAVACTAENADTGQEASSAQPSATVRLSVPRVFATKKGATARDADPIRCRFGHRGAGLRRLERWYALRRPLPSRRPSQASSAALYYVGYESMTPSILRGMNQRPIRLGLSWAASRPAAAGALGVADPGTIDPGTIAHFIASSPGLT